MINYKVFAIIMEEEIVNLIVAENQAIADSCARNVDAMRAMSVDCTNYRCSIGDFYINGSFYFKDKKTVIPDTSIEERLRVLEEDRNYLKSTLDKISKHFNELSNSIDTINEKILNVETALCNLSIIVSKG